MKRSVSIRGHRTSISIEDAFWNEFRAIAARRRIALAALVSTLDGERVPSVNLSSAIRLFVLADLQERARSGATSPQGAGVSGNS